MDIPFLLGTMFTESRNRAKGIGFLLHLLMGVVFAFIYGVIFRLTGLRTIWSGALLGLMHAALLTTAGALLLPAMHPRMAHGRQRPQPSRQLEPPGFLSLNYGRGTPLASALAHALFGAILGFF